MFSLLAATYLWDPYVRNTPTSLSFSTNQVRWERSSTFLKTELRKS